MNKVLFRLVVIAVVAACAVFVYVMRDSHENVAASSSTVASRGDSYGSQNSADGHPGTVRSSENPAPKLMDTSPVEAASSIETREPHPLVKGLAPVVDSYRQRLNDLPEWLSIPESQKNELARLWLTEILSPPEEAGQAGKEKWYAVQRDAGEQIKQLLGPDLHSRWREYEETAVARSQLSKLNSRLGVAALHESVVRDIAAAMTRAARRAEEERQAKYGDETRGPETLRSLDIAQETNRRSNELMREVAVLYLSADQMKTFDEVQKQQQVQYDLSVAGAKARIATQAAESQDQARK